MCFKSLKISVCIVEVNIKIWEVLGEGCVFNAQYFIDFIDCFCNFSLKQTSPVWNPLSFLTRW